MKRKLLLVLFFAWLTLPIVDGVNFVMGRYTHVNGVVWLVVVGVWNALVGMWFLRGRLYK